MKRSEKVKMIRQVLDELFPHPPTPLMHRDEYTLLIAVLLSARSTDAQVNKVTPLLFAKADTPKAMLELSVEEIRQIIRPCGLSPTKARNILGLSKILLDRFAGKVPQNFQDLEALPGVGHKTASVVMAQAFHQPAFPVDTHIHRCAKRWGLTTGKSEKKTEEDLKKLFPKSQWIKLHLQIIYFARAYCPARGHQVEKCPICSAITQNELFRT